LTRGYFRGTGTVRAGVSPVVGEAVAGVAAGRSAEGRVASGLFCAFLKQRAGDIVSTARRWNPLAVLKAHPVQ